VLIDKLVKAIDAPLNILVSSGCPSIPELEALGVRRASIGSGVMRATLGLVRRIGKELLETGTYSSVFEGTIPYAEITELMTRAASNSAEKAHGLMCSLERAQPGSDSTSDE
jgi:2-methylisocitrate lyase-like PEP mutase family enzyme